MTTDAPPMTGPATAETSAEDLRLARLHLRLGMIDAARAELEDLGRRDALGGAGLAALAEARWRAGELEAGGEAAREHLRAGGNDILAIVVAAEAAAVAGRPAEARDLVERAGTLDTATLDALFAGMPRRAYWPAAGQPAPGQPAIGQPNPSAPAPGAAPRPTGAPAPGTPATGAPAAEPARSVPGPGDVLAATAGLWDAANAPAQPVPGAALSHPAGPPTWVEPARQKGHADPEAELETARDELADASDRGLLRLALVLRLDPTLAPDVLEAVRLRREPAALVIRGDAQRLLGRHLEAEAEFAEAAEAIERDAIARARRGGHHATREDS